VAAALEKIYKGKDADTGCTKWTPLYEVDGARRQGVKAERGASLMVRRDGNIWVFLNSADEVARR
jgi:hypothetical protein